MKERPPHPSPWLGRFAWFTAISTLFLICSGGMVTSKGAGLAVPDWPTSFGYNMFLFPVSKWIGGIFFEHIHRLVASTVGLLTIILTVWTWRTEARRWLRNLAFAALAAVIIQGILGGLRVTLLKDEIGIFHACLAQAYFGILIVIAIATSRSWEGEAPEPGFAVGQEPRPPGAILYRIALFTTVLIYLQLALGATMRHQHRDLAILDFPTAYGQIIPDTTPERLSSINQWRDARSLSEVTSAQIWLQMAHRFVAIAIAGGVSICFFLVHRSQGDRRLRRVAALWFLFLALQLSLGAWTIWSNKAADIATAHVAVGAVMFAFGVAMCVLTAPAAEAELGPGSPYQDVTGKIFA